MSGAGVSSSSSSSKAPGITCAALLRALRVSLRADGDPGAVSVAAHAAALGLARVVWTRAGGDPADVVPAAGGAVDSRATGDAAAARRGVADSAAKPAPAAAVAPPTPTPTPSPPPTLPAELDLSRRLGIVVTSSATKSNPSTKMLRYVLSSLALVPGLCSCPLVIACDGYRLRGTPTPTKPVPEDETDTVASGRKRTHAPNFIYNQPVTSEKRSFKAGVVNEDEADRYAEYKRRVKALCARLSEAGSSSGDGDGDGGGASRDVDADVGSSGGDTSATDAHADAAGTTGTTSTSGAASTGTSTSFTEDTDIPGVRFPAGAQMLDLPSRYGFGHAVLECITRVLVPAGIDRVMVIQHDRNFVRGFDLAAVLDAMDADDGIKGVWMLNQSMIDHATRTQGRLQVHIAGLSGADGGADAGDQGDGGGGDGAGTSTSASGRSGSHGGAAAGAGGGGERRGGVRAAGAAASDTADTNGWVWAATPRTPVPGVRLLPLLAFLDSTHVARVDHYQKFIFGSPNGSGRGARIKVGGFIEDKLGQVQLRELKKQGARSHARHGTWILDDGTRHVLVRHVDGSHFDEWRSYGWEARPMNEAAAAGAKGGAAGKGGRRERRGGGRRSRQHVTATGPGAPKAAVAAATDRVGVGGGGGASIASIAAAKPSHESAVAPAAPSGSNATRRGVTVPTSAVKMAVVELMTACEMGEYAAVEGVAEAASMHGAAAGAGADGGDEEVGEGGGASTEAWVRRLHMALASLAVVLPR